MENPSKKIEDNFGLYVIATKPIVGYENLAEICVEYGILFYQLRIKEIREYDLLKIAEKVQNRIGNGVTKFIINDSIMVAKDVGSSGVHLGQNDQSFQDARKILGEKAIVGISTHSVQQVQDACKLLPDYIGIGPVFPTPTKKIPDAVIGLDGMKSMLSASTVPSVCIGGIDFSNIQSVIKNGATNICMVRTICESKDPASVILKAKELLSTTSI